MFLQGEISQAEPRVLRYAAEGDSDYTSVLARVISNTASAGIADTYVSAVCDIIESMSQDAYTLKLYTDGRIHIQSTSPDFRAKISDDSLLDCSVAGITYGDAYPVMLTPEHVGFVCSGDILGTCPLRMYLYALSVFKGCTVTADDVVIGANPFVPSEYDPLEFLVDSLSLEDPSMCDDLLNMLRFVIVQPVSVPTCARFIWVDGAAIPVTKEGTVVCSDYVGDADV